MAVSLAEKQPLREVTELDSAKKQKTSENHYFDLDNRSLIIGKAALEECLKSGANSNGIYPLGVLLEGEVELPEPPEHIPREWTRERMIANGKMICEILGSSSGRKNINRDISYRAYRLGLLPSRRQRKKEFGTDSVFYQEIGATDSHRIGLFPNWTIEDYIKDIRKAEKARGRKVTWEYMAARANGDVRYPHPIVPMKRLDIKRFGTLLELAGYPDIKSWGSEDYKLWGVKFMKANGGIEPNAPDMSFLSKLKRGPSARTIIDHFDRLSSYKAVVREWYEKDLEEQKIELQAKLDLVQEGLSEERLPAEIFDGTTSEEERLLRYARYIVVDELLPKTFMVNKISISTMGNPAVQEAGFVRAIRKCNNAITAGDIESTALYLGVFDILWPLDNYMRDLKVIKSKTGQRIIRSAMV